MSTQYSSLSFVASTNDKVYCDRLATKRVRYPREVAELPQKQESHLRPKRTSMNSISSNPKTAFYNQDGKRVSHHQLREEYFERRERLLDDAFGYRLSSQKFVRHLQSAGTLRQMEPTRGQFSNTSRSSSRAALTTPDLSKLNEDFLSDKENSGRQSSMLPSCHNSHSVSKLKHSNKSSETSFNPFRDSPSFRRTPSSRLAPSHEVSSSRIVRSHQRRLNRALTAHVTRFHAARLHVENNRRIRSAVGSNQSNQGKSEFDQRLTDEFERRPTIIFATIPDDDKENQTNVEQKILVKNDSLSPSVGLESRRTSDVTDRTQSPEGRANKKTFGLRVAVADFAKKVRDNEGMGISTFTYLEESSENASADEFDDHIDIEKPIEPSMEDKKPVMYSAPHLAFSKELTPIGKLRRGIKTIILITKAITTKTEQTRKTNRKYLTFADVEDEIHAATVNQSSFAFSFDVNYYKARKEKTLSHEAIQVFLVHPRMRTEEMIRVATAAMNNTVEAFSEFPKDMQRSLIQRGYYETFGPKKVIIRQGHAALNFYFIISGVTMVSVARQNKMTGETYGETVAFLKKGNSFGELALMYGGKRSATVSCKTDVELLAVSRDDFIDIFMNLNTETEPDHIRFLRKVKLLNTWPIDELPYDDPSICMFTYFRRGTVLSRDSNTNDWIYIIKTGTCRIIKDVPLDANTKTTLLQTTATAETKYRQFLHNQSLYGSAKSKRKSIIKPTQVSIEDPSAMRMKGKLYIQIRILGPGETFGLEPIAFEILGGTTSMTLVSDGAECIGINRGFFKRFVTEPYLKGLRKELQAFPSMVDLEAKLGHYYDWDTYRQLLVEGIGRYKEGLAEIIQI